MSFQFFSFSNICDYDFIHLNCHLGCIQQGFFFQFDFNDFKIYIILSFVLIVFNFHFGPFQTYTKVSNTLH